MAKKAKTNKPGTLEKIQRDQKKESRLLADMANKERVMRWLLIGLVILLLLLILFTGYATDWLRGVKKDSVSTPGSEISASTAGSTTPQGSGDADSGSNTATGSTNGSTATNTGNRSTDTSTGTSNTSKESSTTSTTTTNNNTTTDGGGNSTSSGLLSLYTDSNVGDTIGSVLDQASLLGISASCHTDVLIQTCDFTDGNLTVATKNLLGTGIITSVTKNF